MSELIKALEEDRYGRYEELLIRRDVLRKEGRQYENAYVREFGELTAESFMAKIACIEKKKIIAYCQAIINRGGKVDKSLLESHIAVLMADYHEQLNDLLWRNKQASKAVLISDYESKQIKKIYYAIAKRIHPDMEPGLKDDERIRELWNRTVEAYECNRLQELQELQLLVNEYLASLGHRHDDVVIEDIEEKIFSLEQEIAELLDSVPYVYKHLLHDEQAVEDKKKQLEAEIEEYQRYAGELDEVIASFHLERNYA